MGTVYRTKGKEMWCIKIDSKKKIKQFKKKIKSLYEKNLYTNKNNIKRNKNGINE